MVCLTPIRCRKPEWPDTFWLMTVACGVPTRWRQLLAFWRTAGVISGERRICRRRGVRFTRLVIWTGGWAHRSPSSFAEVAKAGGTGVTLTPSDKSPCTFPRGKVQTLRQEVSFEEADESDEVRVDLLLRGQLSWLLHLLPRLIADCPSPTKG